MHFACANIQFSCRKRTVRVILCLGIWTIIAGSAIYRLQYSSAKPLTSLYLAHISHIPTRRHMVATKQLEQDCSSSRGTLGRRTNERDSGCRVNGLECQLVERSCTSQRPRKTPRTTKRHTRLLALGSILISIPTAVAQGCISLAQSSQCSAFNASSISTDSTLTGLL